MHWSFVIEVEGQLEFSLEVRVEDALEILTVVPETLNLHCVWQLAQMKLGGVGSDTASHW